MTVTSHMVMKQNDDTIRCVDGVESTRGIISDLKDISVANLVSDCLFCKSDRLKHETLVDGVYEDSHLSPHDWLSQNYPSISVVVQTNEKVYSRIVVAGESVVAAIHIPSGADDRWVSQHTSNIAFFRSYRMKLRFVLMRGFLVTRVNGIDFYQALCYSVETASMSRCRITAHWTYCEESY